MKNLITLGLIIILCITAWMLVSLIGYVSHDYNFKVIMCNPAVIFFSVILSIIAFVALMEDRYPTEKKSN